MRYIEILSEDLDQKLAVVKDKLKDTLIRSDADPRLVDDVFDLLVKADPTKNKAYLQWMVTKGISDWSNKTIIGFTVDAPRLGTLVSKFDLLKTKKALPPEMRDINRFKNEAELANALKSYPDEVASKKDAKNNRAQELIDNGEAQVIVNNSKWLIVKPRTKDASCHFGKGTKWCTAATKSENLFDHYKKEGDLYTILLKGENKRWQFFMPKVIPQNLNDEGEDTSVELKDERDKVVDDWRAWHKKYPEVFGEYLSFVTERVREYGELIAFVDDPDERIQYKAAKNSPQAILYVDPEKQCPYAQVVAIRSDPMMILALRNNLSDHAVRVVAEEHPEMLARLDLTPEQRKRAIHSSEKAIKYIKNPTFDDYDRHRFRHDKSFVIPIPDPKAQKPMPEPEPIEPEIEEPVEEPQKGWRSWISKMTRKMREAEFDAFHGTRASL